MVTKAGISSPSSSVQASGAADPTRCKTIREAVDLFMAEKKAVLKPKTYCKYDMVMSLFISCMNRYGWNEIQEKYDGSIEFIDKFKPSLIAECVGEFLSYFMVRKVCTTKEILRASGTVTNQLLKWLWKHKYIEEDHHKAVSSTLKLPIADELSRALYELAEEPLEGEINGYWAIDTVLPSGWVMDPLDTSPRPNSEITLPLPPGIAELGDEGWEVTMGLAKVNGTWRMMPMTVGCVYP